MIKKYILTSETKIFNGRKLYRIKALKPFGNISAGELGGWIESEHNLSQFGDCWIFDDAIVEGQARVYDDAIVGGTAWIYGNACVFGRAIVLNNTRVSGEARIAGRARLLDNAQVSGKAWVAGWAIVSDSALIFESATVSGYAKVFGDARLRGYSCVHGDAEISSYSDILYISQIGEKNDPITFFRSHESIQVSESYRDAIDILEFEELHEDDSEYRCAAELARLHILKGEYDALEEKMGVD